MGKDKKTDRKEEFKLKRLALIKASQGIRVLVEEGEYNTVNEGLLEKYQEETPGVEEFNTFKQWKELGYTINKGSKAFIIWGQPRKAQQAPEGDEEPEEYKYWPVCYLFANTQVYKKGETPEAPPEPQQEAQEVASLEESLLN